MNIIKTFKYYKDNPLEVINHILPIIPLSDEQHLKIWYRIMYGEKLNLENPQTYNEKLQWLKLFYHQPIYTKLVDKYEVKNIVSNLIGDKYVIPLLHVYNQPEEIDFDLLPKQFVLKATHGGGGYGLVVCKDKDKLDKEKAVKKLSKALKTDVGTIGGEWVYKNVPRKIIAEQYMEDNETKELRDYKFFCFDGVPHFLFVASGRGSLPEPYFDWFDMDYNRLDLKSEHPNSPANSTPSKPLRFEEMKEVAAKLSKGMPHVRVDLYECNGKVYFGEYTFFHWSGINHFEPNEWNLKLGQLIKLPETKII